MTDMVELALRDVITELNYIGTSLDAIAEGLSLGEQERRRYALLQAAATIYHYAHDVFSLQDAVNVAEAQLAEIEKKEEAKEKS